jgi:hypothetical protein
MSARSRSSSIVSAGVAAALAVLSLSGCAPGGYSIFDRPQTARDRLPREMVESMDLSDFTLSTSRFSASHNGVDYYLVKPSEGTMGPCIALLGERGPSVSCAGSGVSVGNDPEVQLVPEPAVEGRGWIAISDNLRVRESD